MKLLYSLTGPQREALKLRPGEEPVYCVPVDLEFDNRKMQPREAYAGKVFLVVTGERFLVLEGDRVSAEFLLAECEKIKCEHQVHCGIILVTKKDGRIVCAARFSMRHIVRVAYAARGAQAVIEALRTGEEPGKGGQPGV